MKTINVEEAIYNSLKEKYNKSVLNKKELAHELGISVGTINNYICKGYGIPQYLKVGASGAVRFPLEFVSTYLSEVIEVA